MMASHDQLAALPEAAIEPRGQISDAFLQRAYPTVRAAFEAIWQLPYGRNVLPGEPLAPLLEGRGTCSTKHALLARLLAEQGIAADLCLGIYEMCEANTPGVGATLAAHHLDAVPEAHCYLLLGGTRVDVTRLNSEAAEPIANFLYEEAITPGEIGEHKRVLRRRFIDAWVGDGGGGGLSADEVWAVREACIAALTQ